MGRSGGRALEDCEGEEGRAFDLGDEGGADARVCSDEGDGLEVGGISGHGFLV